MKLTSSIAVAMIMILVAISGSAQGNLKNLSVEQQIQLVYVGLLGRAADRPGLDYWRNEIETGVFTIENLRDNIVRFQPEYLQGFGQLNRPDLVNALYNNLFERDADARGLDYWAFGDGESVAADRLVLALINGAKTTDTNTLANKAAVAARYTTRYVVYDLTDIRNALMKASSSSLSSLMGFSQIDRAIAASQGATCTSPTLQTGGSFAQEFLSAQLSVNRANPDPGYWSSRADLDGDGDDDMLITGALYPCVVSSFNTYAGQSENTHILINEGNNNFSSAKVDRPIFNVHARAALYADFDGNGLTDIFVADHGWDASPFPGFQNALVMQFPDGFRNMSDSLPSDSAGFSHGAAAGDIDNDGDVDIFVVNNGSFGERSPYLLINDGAGNFARDRSRLPSELVDLVEWGSWWANFADLDNDGFVDLVLGGSDASGSDDPAFEDGTKFHDIIFWGDSSYTYRTERMTRLSKLAAVNVVGRTQTIGIDFIDVNNDGRLDVLTGGYDTSFSHRWRQLWINNGDRAFEDESLARLGADFARLGDRWAESIRVIDANGDGHLDLIREGASILNEDSLIGWVNGGNGFFTPWRAGDAGLTSDSIWGGRFLTTPGLALESISFFDFESSLTANSAVLQSAPTVNCAD